MLKPGGRWYGWKQRYDAWKLGVLVILECGNAKMEGVEVLKKWLLSIIRATSLRLNLFCALMLFCENSLSGHTVLGHQKHFHARTLHILIMTDLYNHDMFFATYGELVLLTTAWKMHGSLNYIAVNILVELASNSARCTYTRVVNWLSIAILICAW